VKLYYVPMTRATRARWMLEELGIPYELHRLDLSRKENRGEAYLGVHPLGHVPALVDEEAGVTMFESAAIVMYLADRHPEKRLAPPVGSPLRASYYQWMCFVPATMEPPLATVFDQQTKLPEAERSPRVIDAAKARWRTVCAALDRAVDGKKYILGDEFSAADIMVGSALAWSKAMGLLEEQPRLVAYSKRAADRPAFRAARAD
jgi:glutathione S-transferase